MKSVLKSIYKNLETNSAKLEEAIEKREDVFYDRSEKWQESEKGQEYEQKTEVLQGILDEVDSLYYLIEEEL
jgi:predicted nuclease with TOPRIM domain